MSSKRFGQKEKKNDSLAANERKKVVNNNRNGQIMKVVEMANREGFDMGDWMTCPICCNQSPDVMVRKIIKGYGFVRPRPDGLRIVSCRECMVEITNGRFDLEKYFDFGTVVRKPEKIVMETLRRPDQCELGNQASVGDQKTKDMGRILNQYRDSRDYSPEDRLRAILGRSK